MKHAVIAAALVIACVCLSVSASYFLFGRNRSKVADLNSRMAAAGILMQMDGSAIKAVNAQVDAVSGKLDKFINLTSTALDGIEGAGVFESDWWCGSDAKTGECFRSQADCSSFESHANQTCVPRHIAFCAPPRVLSDYDFCFRTLAMCQGFGISGHQSCKGVE